MKASQSVSYAVAAILGAHAAASVAAAAAEAAAGESDSDIGISEVVVTAQRRTQSAQDVPIALQILTADTLTQLNVKTFDDFVKYLPNVSSQGIGPGQDNIYMRGLGNAVGALQSSGVIGSFPNVAVYLDDQSTQLPGRNLDIYTADLERIEVLEGPQGTLFGAGAQAGVVRYITNKPKLDVTEGFVNAAYETTAHGDPSNRVDATLNLPVVPDTLAVRAVIYNESRGGYIDNIPGTFARSSTDLGIHYAYAGGAVPANSVSINNSNLVENNINSVTYKGIRASALWKINEDWNALLVQSYQNMEADGVFAQQAVSSAGVPQPDLTVQLYNPSYDKDKFTNTALTVNGRIGALKAVYTGGYLVRNVEQVQDYTNYARGLYADYYQCVNPGATAATAQCFSPSTTWHDRERNTHMSHELRFSTPDEWRARGILGGFYEKYTVQEQVDWLYKTATDDFNPIAPPTGYYQLNGSSLLPSGAPVTYKTPGAAFVPTAASSANPGVRGPNTAFADDITRGYNQKAIFGSADYDIIPKVLTITGGTRYYRIESTEGGSFTGSFGCQTIFNPSAPNPCVNHSNGFNLNSIQPDKAYSGFRSRANLTWKVTDDALLYYTWSQGFRAGGFNRPNSVGSGSPVSGVFTPPVAFKPDTLVNNEIGWKTQWWDRRVQFNAAIYREDWKNTQIQVFDPGVTGNLSFTANGGDYRVKGLETSLVARLTHDLTVIAAAAWNQSELVKEAQFTDGNGNVINWSQYSKNGAPLSNPGGVTGSPLAGSPPFEGNIRIRYDVTLADYEAFAQVGATHQAHSYASTDLLTKDLQGHSIAYDDPAFTTYDASAGVSRDAWALQVYGQNLSDTRAQLYANYRQWYKAVSVNRPRTIGLSISYKLKGAQAN